MRISNSKWLSWKNWAFGLTIIYFFDGRSLLRHKQSFFILQVNFKLNISSKEVLCYMDSGRLTKMKRVINTNITFCVKNCLNLNGALPSRKSFLIRAHLLNAKFLFWSWWRSALNEINNLALYLWKISGLALLQHNKHTYILKNAQFIGVFSSKKSYLSIDTSCKKKENMPNN